MYKTPIGKKYLYLHSYYLKNKEKIAAKSAARYIRCKDIIKEQHKTAHKLYRNTIHGRYTIAKQMGIRRARGSWTISYAQFLLLVDKPCFYCGLTVEKHGTGLDRIDSSIGYLFENVRPCCKRCNQAKSDMPEKEFYSHIRRIYTQLNLEVEPLAF
jgi:hypothetical protein